MALCELIEVPWLREHFGREVWMTEKPVSRFTSCSETYRPSSLTVAQGLDPSVVHRIELELLPERPDKECLRDRLVKKYHKNFDEEIRTPKYDGIVWVVGRVLHDGVVR